MVKAIDRKLLRDLVALRGQVITIALVVACGMAAWVAARGTWQSLQTSRDRYYEEDRLADVFVHLERAPVSVLDAVEAVPGVARAHGRLVEGALVPIETLADPATATVVSVDRGEQPALDALRLRGGRLPEPGRGDEVVVIESFARAHHLEPGSRIPVVLNGVRRDFTVTGVALSPEFVFAIEGGGFVMDPARFAVLWMDRDVVAGAFRLEGTFDDVVLRLQPGASVEAVTAGVDRVLVPYGGLGAYGRDRAPSPRAVDSEIGQLRGIATVVPAIFIGVAAFLLNVVLARLVLLQRTEIAVLKAFGYADHEIGLHFVKLASVIIVLGSGLGVALGVWVGRAWTNLYGDYFQFPTLAFVLDPGVVASGLLVTLGAGGIGAWAAVRSAVRLPPAQAMQPPAPARYRRSFVESVGLRHVLGTSGRMVVRELSRRPVRTLLSTLGIAMAFAILVLGRFSHDSVDELIALQFGVAQREDVAVALRHPVPSRDLSAFAHMSGVVHVEGLRAVPARVGAGALRRDVALLAYEDGATLRRPVEAPGRAVPLPRHGALLTRQLATILGAHVGQTVSVETLQGARRTIEVFVAGLVDEPFGLQIHMRLAEASALLGEEPAVSLALLSVAGDELDLERALRDVPMVASIGRRRAAVEQLERQMEENTAIFATILTAFAAAIAVGVVYNNARVALSVRARDLATLRVLGFEQREVAAMLFGETAVQVALAMPLGALVARGLAALVMSTVDVELYRFPVVVYARTYALAATVIVASAIASAWLVRRRIARLDLVGVLKTRD